MEIDKKKKMRPKLTIELPLLRISIDIDRYIAKHVMQSPKLVYLLDNYNCNLLSRQPEHPTKGMASIIFQDQCFISISGLTCKIQTAQKSFHFVSFNLKFW